MSEQQSSLVVTDLWKSYGSNTVLKGVDLELRAGRVHALLGANGAGKSTLLSCLSGAARPDSGDITVAGTVHAGFTPLQAFDAGIAIIYQHFQLIGPLSVSDNVFLGSELKTNLGLTDRARQEAETREVFRLLGLDVDPKRAVETLSVGEQQMVEIARAVRRKPSVLILDEPTAALGVHEVDALLALVRRLARGTGISVVYVSHLLGEILEISDDVTVLRDGEVLWSRARADIGLSDLVDAISPDRREQQQGNRALDTAVKIEFEQLSGGFTGPIDLALREGEIVGVFGLLGSGRTDLLETIAGVRPRAGGTIRLGGKPVDHRSPRAAISAGIALVASDRKEQSLFGEMAAVDNLLMPHLSKLAKGMRNRAGELAEFADVAGRVGLVPNNPLLPADSFSGGNAQKIAVGRWAAGSADVQVLLLDEPTQGVDVGARSDLYDLIRGVAEAESMAVIFASSDPEEIVALADRVIVLVDGEVRYSGPNELDEAELTALAQPESTERNVSV
ncbi:MAG: sugar ABC transporter ATP-binding protein [Herbiconiux sp.]|uniref:sugar ABC transporter ATP-binding protein n=1 Tax=Herbiconiux sp. TaxID=1871186 RepID=UPI00120C6CBF|nr:sugar ABC transporter ATP-binding protein [Herbiconiux sp.]TAJ46938.1 MAG: sugar ABC transporter ATP-binding protein [Herbiconiux sp.]